MMSEILTESCLDDTKRMKEILAMLKSRLLMKFQSSGHTTAALRAAEIESDAILMAKNGVDGVYNDDPRKNADAVKFDKLTHVEVIKRGLKIMDATASTLSMDNDIDLVVFNMNEPGNIKRVIFGEQIGTTVSNKAELRK